MSLGPKEKKKKISSSSIVVGTKLTNAQKPVYKICGVQGE